MLTLRAAAPEDAAAVAAVHVRSWQAAYRGLLPDEYLASLRPEERMAHYKFGATDPNLPVTIVAACNNAICGFVTTGPCRDADVPEGGELFALYVDPEKWKLGIGRRLVEAARAQLIEGGFARAVLWVLAGNVRAERFYLADGWRPDDQQRTAEMWGVTVNEIRYHRDLP